MRKNSFLYTLNVTEGFSSESDPHPDVYLNVTDPEHWTEDFKRK